MRVITGIARGRRLKTLDGPNVRPTSDKVKESIFSIINFDLPSAVVLDLFAGSGQLGIEALSRGAGYVYFVDSARSSCDIVRENLLTVGLQQNTRVANMDSIDFLRNAKYTFDIALLDPPYRKDLIQKALPLLEPRMADNGKILCEHELGLELPEKVGRFALSRKYKYGKIEISLYTSEGETSCQE